LSHSATASNTTHQDKCATAIPADININAHTVQKITLSSSVRVLPKPLPVLPNPIPATTEPPTPVNRVKLIQLLHETKYDAQEIKFLDEGFHFGFRTGFQGEEQELMSSNSMSTREHPDAVSKKILREIELGRIAGPFKYKPFTNFKVSPLALREKQQQGEYRLLHNLSYPYDEKSVNYNIPREASTIQYQQVRDARRLIADTGRGAYLSKSDIAGAFRIIPLHADEYHLFGFKWKNEYYFDKCLPMGCSSACQIFERFSNAMVWILERSMV
jgi:hypothetical protein